MNDDKQELVIRLMTRRSREEMIEDFENSEEHWASPMCPCNPEFFDLETGGRYYRHRRSS